MNDNERREVEQRRLYKEWLERDRKARNKIWLLGCYNWVPVIILIAIIIWWYLSRFSACMDEFNNVYHCIAASL